MPLIGAATANEPATQKASVPITDIGLCRA